MLSEGTLRKLDAFSLSMREFARGYMGGARRSKTQGDSVEFHDFRSYTLGDDPRRIDWNAFARFDKLFIKLFLDEQETSLRVLLDASASMRYDEPDKWDLAIRLAATLSYISLARYDRVTIVKLQGESAEASRTFSGRQAYPQVEAYLASIAPSGKTILNRSLPRVPILSGRGICVLISDLLSDEGWTQGAKTLLHKRQELTVLHLLSPKELSPDFSGSVRLIDSEDRRAVDVQISQDAIKRYDRALNAFLLEQQKFCFQRAVPYLLLRSDMDLEKDVLRALLGAGVIAAR